MKSHVRTSAVAQLSFAELDATTDLSNLMNESDSWNIAPSYTLQNPTVQKELVESTEPTQIHISAINGHVDLSIDDSEYVEWNIASIKDMQIAIVDDAATLISKAYARQDNLEDIFAWVFDSNSEDAFSVSECAKAFNQTTFELQRRFYRCLKRKINSLNSKVSKEKREFYCKLAKKARTCLAKNADYIVCTEVEAQVAQMESEYRPKSH